MCRMSFSGWGMGPIQGGETRSCDKQTLYSFAGNSVHWIHVYQVTNCRRTRQPCTSEQKGSDKQVPRTSISYGTSTSTSRTGFRLLFTIRQAEKRGWKRHLTSIFRSFLQRWLRKCLSVGGSIADVEPLSGFLCFCLSFLRNALSAKPGLISSKGKQRRPKTTAGRPCAPLCPASCGVIFVSAAGSRQATSGVL